MRCVAVRALIVAGVLLSACRSAPPTRYYVLAPARPIPAAASPAGEASGLRIGVEPFTVDPPYDRDQLVYRLGTDSTEVGFYSYHRWAAPLGELVAVAMAEGLRGTAGIDAIEPITSGGDYTAILRGRVVYLEEIDLPGHQQARLRFELRLVGRGESTLWWQEVSGSAEGDSNDVAEIVELLYDAFRQAVEQARSGLSELAAEREAAWPLACSVFPPEGEPLPDCARRESDGEIVLRAGVVTSDGESAPPEAVIVEGELLFALASGRTAPALPYDNGPDYFVEGLARSPRDGKVGFVDERLELVVPREWDFAFPFENGVARVCTGCAVRREGGDEHSEVEGGLWGYVDRRGRVVVPVEYPRNELPAPASG